MGVVVAKLEDGPGRPGAAASLHTSSTTHMTTTETTVITSTTVINNAANQLNGSQVANGNPNFVPPTPFDELQLSDKIRQEQLIRDFEHEPIITEFPIRSNLPKQKKLFKGKSE